ncbi:MAG: GDP-L-fucose synthase [Deltaproteobacteria bacterium]|nr:GDP-L-fucose synthase [Deltaproteobacteria bacterium]
MTATQNKISFAASNPRAHIYVAGHRGMVGSAIVSRLQSEGYDNIVTRTHQELDLIDQQAARNFFQNKKIDYVVLAAAKVGGIHANNTYPADFIYQNLMITSNVIYQAFKSGVKRLLFLGSSCIYPKHATQPMKEEDLLTGKLEPTNEPYAVAKIAGVKLCESFNRQHGTRYYAVMPNNLYGPNDNYDLENSHVLPAMIRKFHLAKLAGRGDWAGINKDQFRFGDIPDDFMACLVAICKSFGHNHKLPDMGLKAQPAVNLWGSGSPRREFVHVDDMADACIFLMNREDEVFDSLFAENRLPLINIGCGTDITIRDLAGLIAEIVGYQGDIVWDGSRPDGTPRKLLDISKLEQLGWESSISLAEGIKRTYEWYLAI